MEHKTAMTEVGILLRLDHPNIVSKHSLSLKTLYIFYDFNWMQEFNQFFFFIDLYVQWSTLPIFCTVSKIKPGPQTLHYFLERYQSSFKVFSKALLGKSKVLLSLVFKPDNLNI